MKTEPPAKRLKGSSLDDAKLQRSCIASFLVDDIPKELTVVKVKNDIERFQTLFEGLGFRASVVQSPRRALSIYLDSSDLGLGGECRPSPQAFLATAIGMNFHQDILETLYRTDIRSAWCLLLFCKRIQQACATAINGDTAEKQLQALLTETIGHCVAYIRQDIESLPFDETKRLDAMSQLATTIDARVRPDQLDRELDRIRTFNTTLTNAIARRLFEFHGISMKDVVFKDSHQPQYKRLSFYLYDREIDEVVPPTFLFLPCLHRVLRFGCQEVVTCMVKQFWAEMLKRGYFASNAIRMAMEPNLMKYFQFGLSKDPKIPLIVNAHFTPSFPLCYYFHGKAGAGKSSLVRAFGPSLNAVIEQYADPAMLVRFVKQNLNKTEEILRLELDLRPNNNDMSVMSIIQSRRMTLGQSKPGLVVVGFEEMPDYGSNRDPEQLATCQLISQRFAGRKGEYKGGSAPRNSAKRGISGDATIVPIFTSNYNLQADSATALQHLDMFQELCVISIHAISGQDRIQFAKQYTGHCLEEKGWTKEELSCVTINIDVGEGDTRPLVRKLRMIAFYMNRVKVLQPRRLKTISVDEGKGNCCYCIQVDGVTTMQLERNLNGNLHATKDSMPSDPDPNVLQVASRLETFKDELATILMFWLEHALAPAVIVTQNEVIHNTLVDALTEYARTSDRMVRILPSVDASQHKMMKSLYDDSETKNLKDDIMALGGGKGDPFVVHIACPTVDSQLCIREMIEDTPSQTAFSSEKSALHKSGILFVVMVHDEITPEVRSRASLVL